MFIVKKDLIILAAIFINNIILLKPQVQLDV